MIKIVLFGVPNWSVLSNDGIIFYFLQMNFAFPKYIEYALRNFSLITPQITLSNPNWKYFWTAWTLTPTVKQYIIRFFAEMLGSAAYCLTVSALMKVCFPTTLEYFLELIIMIRASIDNFFVFFLHRDYSKIHGRVFFSEENLPPSGSPSLSAIRCQTRAWLNLSFINGL